MNSVIILLVVVLAVIIYFLAASGRPPAPSGKEQGRRGEGEWEFGDEWKQGSPDDETSEKGIQYVEVLRGDTGRGFDDSSMMDLVSYLGSRGVRATYDSFSIGLEPAAIKTYALKVEAGKEEEAMKKLEEKLS
ncbi:MAG: hypothetical protein AABZ10_09080 [Nitrospirota bacterium]|mgnify:FL=1